MEEVPSRLDLVFTKELDIVDDIGFMSSIGKSGFVLIEFKLNREKNNARNEVCRAERNDYRKMNFT